MVELARRLANVVRPGVVAEVDYRGELVRVKFAEEDAALTAWLPWLTSRAGCDASWWAPEIGEQVLLLSPSGDLANAVAMPALYSTSHPAPSGDPDKHLVRYSDGAEIEYDRANHVLRAVLPAGGAVRIEAPDGLTFDGDATFNGKVTVNGEVEATGDIHTDGNLDSDGQVEDLNGSMTEMRGRYNAHVHGVPPGIVTPPIAPAHRMT